MKKWKELAQKPREEVEEELRIDSSKRRDSLIQFGENPDDEKSDDFKKDDSIPEENETQDCSSTVSDENSQNAEDDGFEHDTVT